MEPLSLNAIGRECGTDKSSKKHDYLSFYELFFAPIRNEKLTILEIGVLEGQSLRTWERYFPRARIIGVDIVHASRRFKSERTEIEIADQSDVQQLTDVAHKHGPFDIIIEDGSHMWEHQITTLRTLFPFLRPRGLYIVEDLQTNYGALVDKYRGISSLSCVEYLKKWLDLRVATEHADLSRVEDAFLRSYGRSIRHISFFKHACLIEKSWSGPAKPKSHDVPLLDDAIRAASQPVDILAHLSRVGDLYGEHGVIHFADGREMELQLLELRTEAHALEYKVRDHEGHWSAWAAEGAPLGTRGKSKFLRGVAVRVKEDLKSRFSVRTTCRFKGAADVVMAHDGAELTTESSSALCALQIDLTPKT